MARFMGEWSMRTISRKLKADFLGFKHCPQCNGNFRNYENPDECNNCKKQKEVMEKYRKGVEDVRAA
jgi:hypothetical protein